MKKTLLFLLLLGVLSSHGQTQIYFDDFEDQDISDWTLYDGDGDNNWWGDQFTVNNSSGVAVTPVSLISRSWLGSPLTPDNWAVTPLIDLSAYPVGSTVTLSWKVKAAAASWDQENYSVYAATANDVATLTAATVTFNEIYDDPGDTGPILDRTLDLSALAGQGIYIAFRHHDCTDMDYLCIDEVKVTATSLKTDEFFASNFSFSPNPTKDVINISNKNSLTMKSAVITDMNGRIVENIDLKGMSNSQINVSELNSGVYFLKITTDQGVGTTKIIKN